jgi:hypothetical protein
MLSPCMVAVSLVDSLPLRGVSRWYRLHLAGVSGYWIPRLSTTTRFFNDNEPLNIPLNVPSQVEILDIVTIFWQI